MAELSKDEVGEIALECFREKSNGNPTLIWPLSEWDEAKLRSIFKCIAARILATGNRIDGITADDVKNSDKVGNNVDSFATAIHGALKAIEPELAATLMASLSGTGALSAAEQASYLAGYRDATLSLIADLGSGKDAPPEPKAAKPAKTAKTAKAAKKK